MIATWVGSAVGGSAVGRSEDVGSAAGSYDNMKLILE